jgi:hypothetical protein
MTTQKKTLSKKREGRWFLVYIHVKGPNRLIPRLKSSRLMPLSIALSLSLV